MERDTLMTDRELVRLAALSMGIYIPKELDKWVSYSDLTGYQWWNKEETVYKTFNPLNDDGQALRLAVKLELSISFETWTDGSEVVLVEDESEYFDPDRFAASRRAIVLAAAKIAKESEEIGMK